MKLIRWICYQLHRNHDSHFRCWDCVHCNEIRGTHKNYGWNFYCDKWKLIFHNSYKLEHDGCSCYSETERINYINPEEIQ